MAAARGEIPTLKMGRRIIVPVPKLLALLGASELPDIDSYRAPDRNPGATTAARDRLGGVPQAEIRKWALSNGIPVNTKGAVPNSVIAMFMDAHPEVLR